jgi:hypothetical protein
MARVIRQPFKPGGKFLASKNFKFNGVKYPKGKEFPWRTICCSVRKLRQLYEGRFIKNEFVDEEEETPIECTPVIDDLDEDTSEVITEEEEPSEDEPTDDEPITVYDPEIHEIVNPERGEWYIDLDGIHLVRLKAKEAKRLRKRTTEADINMDHVIEE